MKNIFTFFKIAIPFFFAVALQPVLAQNTQGNDKAWALVKKHAAAIGLTGDNIANSRISGTYDDAISGATMVYLQQTYMGIDVDKLILVLAFKNDALVSATGNHMDLKLKTMAASPALQKKMAIPAVTAASAIQAAAQHLQLAAPSAAVSLAQEQDLSKPTDVGDLGIAKENVTVRLLWEPQKTLEKIKLCWEVNLSPKKTPDSWRVIVDATAGNVVKKENYTVNDNWDKINEEDIVPQPKVCRDTAPAATGSPERRWIKDINSVSYRVIPYPAEAPNFPNGAPALVTDPWKLLPAGSGAAPFNWNSDGIWQYKLSRGNNVLAQEDTDGYNGHGKKAKGKVNNDHLSFDFMPDFDKPPVDSSNQGFGITNLFYWNNIMHDLAYQYGFDEQSGNFQQNNLGRGGKGLDLVFADAMDGGGFNNANFYTPPDGQHPVMQMYLWSGKPGKAMKINSPSAIAGTITAAEGAVSPNNLLVNIGPVTGDVVLYDESTDTLHLGCDTASNSSALNGKIALINRGTCFFTQKILNAQIAGAIAVVIVNNIPGDPPFVMGGFDTAIVIPAVMISYEDGLKIKAELASGTNVNVTLSYVPSIDTDGDLDNGIICHEYAHGISNRLTGGADNVTCLFNAEEMGEGWSDYIGLMNTTDWSTATVYDGLKPRGIGTYAVNQSPNGRGIRTYPYTVDMSVNPHTYADLATFGEVHYIGEVWTSALWDMTWFLVVQDGINKDIFNAQGEGGNTVAYKLVMTGMKLQPCNPGFIDGRDAILRADTLLYNGRHSCAIWRAFARRGMGVGAHQGSSFVTGDELVDFTDAAILITKHADKTTAPGNELEYAIGLKAKTVCGGSIKPNYSVTDSLPLNVTYVSSDGTYNPTKRTVTFSNINMNSGDSLTLHIKVKVNDNTAFPDSVYLDDQANTNTITDQWVVNKGKQLAWTTLFNYYYYSNDNSEKDATSLTTAKEYEVPGTATTFRFWNEIYAHDFMNGGVVEVTTDGGQSWEDAGPYMSGFVYNETIYGNSILNGRNAFSGFGNYGYTNIDLSPFRGKKIKIRFLYATSDSTVAFPDGGSGWVVNEISLAASATVTNTAKLFAQNKKLKDLSTVVTKIAGGNKSSNFIAVKRNDAEALLSWLQPGEVNGSFMVERSIDNGVTFKEIGRVHTRGTNGNVPSCHFTDASPAEGINLYRIGHKGSNGKVDYTAVKALSFDNTAGVRVSPNPAKDRIVISIPGNNKMVTLQLSDGTGKYIKTYKAAGQSVTLRLPALATGVYYLTITRSNGTTSRHKILIE